MILAPMIRLARLRQPKAFSSPQFRSLQRDAQVNGLSIAMRPRYEALVEWPRRCLSSCSSQGRSAGRAPNQSHKCYLGLLAIRGCNPLISRQKPRHIGKIRSSFPQPRNFATSRPLSGGFHGPRKSPLSREAPLQKLSALQSRSLSQIHYRSFVFSGWARGITYAFIGAFAFATLNIYQERQRVSEEARRPSQQGLWRSSISQTSPSPWFGIEYFSYRIIDYPPKDWKDLKQYFLALFGHASITHLAANSFGFYFMSSFLMPRIGIGLTSALFLVGGTCANLAYAHVQHAWLTGKYRSLFKVIKV